MATTEKTTAEKQAEKTISDLQEQIAALKTEMGRITENFAEAGKDAASRLSDRAQDAVKTARSRAKDIASDVEDQAHIQAERIKDGAQRGYEQAGEFISRQPATAVGLAAGLGFLLGVLMNRR
ncbi:DUF883 family protein [Ketogulonicigenium vulgare]|uniref:DUF883 family protein n=1 Tax=Ketogulonicigenium vulgare TaxID=92945 RepID=UPI0023593688|nr:hypothetical protein [Ketogulonicigenium vulgare]